MIPQSSSATVAISFLLAMVAAPALAGGTVKQYEATGAAIFVAISGNAGLVVNATWTGVCPPDQYCSSFAEADPPGDLYWSLASHYMPGDLAVDLETIAGDLSAPVVEPSSDGRTVTIVVNAEFGQDGVYLLDFISTHPGRLSVTTSEGELSGSVSSDVSWYRPSDLPGVVNGKVGQPGVALLSELAWVAEQGGFGVLIGDITPAVGYELSTPMGPGKNCPVAGPPVVPHDVFYMCTEGFYGPPGEYSVKLKGVANERNQPFLAWVDMPIPAPSCIGGNCNQDPVPPPGDPSVLGEAEGWLVPYFCRIAAMLVKPVNDILGGIQPGTLPEVGFPEALCG